MGSSWRGLRQPKNTIITAMAAWGRVPLHGPLETGDRQISNLNVFILNYLLLHILLN